MRVALPIIVLGKIATIGRASVMINVQRKLVEDMRLRGFSELTEKTYSKAVKCYLDFLGRYPRKDRASADIRRYSMALRKRGLSYSTINTYLSAIMFMYEVVLDNPVNRKQAPLPKRRKKLPYVPPPEDVAALMSAAPNPRARALISLGAGSGLRISEAVAVKVDDVDSREMRLFVEDGKGGKDRYTILSQASLDCLREYWVLYRPRNPQGWLFPSGKGPNHISEETCRAMLREAIRASGIGGARNVTFHTLRHYFGTRLVESGVELHKVKELLGHSSISTTMVYVHLANTTGGVTSPIDMLPGEMG